MTKRSRTIGIRLAPELENQLRDEAAKRGLPPTTYATRLLVEALTAGANPTEARFAELREILLRLEDDLPRKLRAVVESKMLGGFRTPPESSVASTPSEASPKAPSGFDSWLKKPGPVGEE